VSRVLDPVAHAARREAYVDAAEALLRTGGYAGVSVGEVIAAAGGSKGGFYHYFTGKQELLEAVVARLAAATSDVVAELVADPAADAVETFAAVVHAMPAGQSANRDLMLGLLTVWYAEDNAAAREAIRQSSHAALVAPLRTLVARGRRQGAFAPSSDDGTADVLATVLLGMSDAAGRLWLARQAGTVSLEAAVRALDAYADATERVLGVPPGTAFPQDRELVRSWFA
jgi:AcrR family transcriptional regulator